MSRRVLFLGFVLLLSRAAAAADAVFHFAPPDGTRFTRTLTRTARMEWHGLVRTEVTVFRARFVVREASPGFHVTVTPLSFQYRVNDHETPSPVWELIRGHILHLIFNVAGKLNEVRGYDGIDDALTNKPASLPTADDPSFHIDRQSIGEQERAIWNERTLLWLSQPAAPGTKLEFDSSERGFNGERVKSHTLMRVLRSKPCGAATCVMTTYRMVPDLTETRRRINETQNDDFIDAAALEEIEQLIEPATMLPHYERLIWKSSFASQTPDGQRADEATWTEVSEYVYDVGAKAKQR